MGVTVNISLRSRFVLLIALLAGTIAVVPAVYLPRVLEAQSRRWVESRYLDVTRAVAAVAEAPLEFEDAGGAAKALAGLGRTRGAAYAQLSRADGGLLATWGTMPGGTPVPAGDGAVAYARDLLHLRVDVVGRGGGRGTLLAGFRLDELEERRREAAAVVWRTTGVALAVAVAAAFLLGTVLLKPLRRVTALAARIAGGDEDAAGLLAELERGDETGRFAASLGKVVERLAEKRTLLESLSEASSEAVLTLAPGGSVLFHNQRLGELVGAGRGQALGTWAAVRDRLRPLLAHALPAWMEADGPQMPGDRAEPFRLEYRDGRIFEAYAAQVRTRGGTSRGLGLYLRDISRLSEAEGSVRSLHGALEEQVGALASELEAVNAALAARTGELERARSEKEAAERRVAAEGFAAREIARSAHQISGNLAYALKALQRLTGGLRSSSPGEPVMAAGTATMMADSLHQAVAAAQRIGQLLRSGPDGAPDSAPQPEAVPLSRAVADAAARAAKVIRLRATVEQDLRPAPAVRANEGQLKRLVTLLVTDAASAVPQGEPANHVVRVSVGTDGKGQPYAEVVRPTPRAAGAGGPVGPGAATAWPELAERQAAARSLGGSLEVRASQGAAAARLVLPAAGDAAGAPSAQAATARRPAPASSGARILVVDDEPLVGAAVRRMLGSAHGVDVTSSGAEALARLRQGEHFDLVICDLAMPGLSGMEVAEQLVPIRPALAKSMLFMSSGILSGTAEAFVDMNKGRVLRKPFERSALLQLVEQRLGPRSVTGGATP